MNFSIFQDDTDIHSFQQAYLTIVHCLVINLKISGSYTGKIEMSLRTLYYTIKCNCIL